MRKLGQGDEPRPYLLKYVLHNLCMAVIVVVPLVTKWLVMEWRLLVFANFQIASAIHLLMDMGH